MNDDCQNLDNVKATPDHRSVMDALSLEVIGEGEDGRIRRSSGSGDYCSGVQTGNPE